MINSKTKENSAFRLLYSHLFETCVLAGALDQNTERPWSRTPIATSHWLLTSQESGSTTAKQFFRGQLYIQPIKNIYLVYFLNEMLKLNII